MSDNLRPCPFCGGLARMIGWGESNHAMKCYRCAVEGPMRQEWGKAITAWNTRAADSPRSGVLVPSDKLAEMQAEIAALTAERDALQRFKDFEHCTLDSFPVPTHPDGPHSKEGCRIGDRLDWLRDRIAALTREPDEAEVERVAKAMAFDWDSGSHYMQESYRIMARAAIAACIAGRKS